MIQVENVTKLYHAGTSGNVQALRGVSLHVVKGEFVAIMGASGCGKSTLMNVIGTLDRPDEGRIRLDGKDVSDLDDQALSHLRNRTIGFVFQSFNLLPLASALENVALPLAYAEEPTDEEERARKALQEVGLSERAHHRPGQLSGGQQQRVAIARALITDPQIILADEPTGNLDTQASTEVMTIFEKLSAAGKTIVLVTHEPDIAAYAERILTMRDGQVVSDERVRGRRSAIAELATASQAVAS